MDDEIVASEGHPKFIRDEPAAQDSFGAHTRLAKAITTLIGDDPHMKVIGILGPWGSGKSTVVRSIESQVTNKSTETHFFAYDAWLHQSDPVRRSFLEALVAFLSRKVGLDKAEWEERLEKLSGSVEETKSESAPVLTRSGKFIIASLGLLPLGFALVGYDALKDALATPPVYGAGIALGFGLLFSLAPAIAAILIYFCWRPWGTDMRSRAFWTTNRKPHERESVLGLLTDRSIDRTFNVTTRQPEPTSIEFQRIFRDLMNEGSAKGHRFVFVIDNLDRLAEREALQIWSAIRSFFLGTSDSPIDKTSSYLPTVILPVDTNSIRRMFSVEHGKEDSSDLCKAFMEKTFDITFDVPEPVMSDWQLYLSKQLRHCFGDLIDDVGIYWATRFLDDKRRIKDLSVVTPRSINKYVNHIAALYEQRASNEIEISTLAYYSTYANMMEGGVFEFIQGEATPSNPPSANWKVQLAATHYGVDLAKARQILLADPIRTAIERLNFDTFTEIGKIEGFPTELRRVLTTASSDDGGDPGFLFMTNAVLLLDKVISTDDHWLAETWRLIANQYLRSTGPNSPPAEFEERIASVLRNSPADLRQLVARVTAEKISRTLQIIIITAPSINSVFVAADRLVRECTALELEVPNYEPTLDPPNFFTLICRLSSFPNVWKRLHSNHKLSDLAPVIAERLRSTTAFSPVESGVRILLTGELPGVSKSADSDWSPVIETAIDLLQNQNGSSSNVGMSATVLGLLQGKSKVAREALQSLTDDGHLLARTHEAASSKATHMLSSGYAVLLYKGSDFGPPSGWSWETFFESFPSETKNIASRIAEFFGPVIAPSVWAALQSAPTGQPLTLRVIEHLIKEQGLGNLIIGKTVREISDYLRPLQPALQRQFLTRLSNYSGFWDEIEAIEDSTVFLLVARLMRHNTGELRNELTAVVRKRLAKVQADGWLAALKAGGPVFQLSHEFSSELPRWSVKSALSSVLVSNSDFVTKTTDTAIMKRWFRLREQLTDTAAENAIEALIKHVTSGGYVGDLLGLLKESNGSIINGKSMSPDALVRRVVVPLLDARPGRKWVEGHAHELSGPLSKSSQDAVAGLRSEVDRLARSKSKWKQEDAVKLRRIFGLK